MNWKIIYGLNAVRVETLYYFHVLTRSTFFLKQKESTVATTYTTNPRSMMQVSVLCSD